jgi:hypothetical protein
MKAVSITAIERAGQDPGRAQRDRCAARPQRSCGEAHRRLWLLDQMEKKEAGKQAALEKINEQPVSVEMISQG